MHGRVLVNGGDRGGGVLIAPHVVLTAAHVVENSRPAAVAFSAGPEGEFAHRIRTVVTGSLDVAALVLEKPTTCITEFGMPSVNTRWVAGARREPSDITLRGSVVAVNRVYEDEQRRQCRVHEVIVDGAEESLSGYSGTALCLEAGVPRVFGILFEAGKYEWLKRLGYDRSTGRAFALDIYAAIECIKNRGLDSLLLDVPGTHGANIAKSARERPRRIPHEGEARQIYIDPAPELVRAVSGQSWLGAVRQVLTRIEQADIRAPFSPSISSTRIRLSSPVTVDSARDAIRQLNVDSLGGQLNRARIPRQAKLVAQSGLRELRKLEKSSSGVITGISGPFGSGKSRLLLELENSLNAVGAPALKISPLDIGDIESDLLAKLRSTMLVDVAELNDVTKAFWNREEPIVVLVDDLDVACRRSPRRLNQFFEAVRRMSALPGLRWIVAADDSRLSVLIPAPPTAFWQEYGSDQPRPFPLSGWIDLGARNIKHRVGNRIISGIQTSSLPELEAAEPSVQETLASPLAAWLRIEHAQDVAITALNRSEFIRSYRQTVLDDVDSLNSRGILSVSGANVDSVMREIGVQLSAERADSCTVRFNRSRELDLQKETISAALDVLSARGLIQVERFQTSCRVQLKFVPLWAHEVFTATEGRGANTISGWNSLARAWSQSGSTSDLGEALLTHIYSQCRPEVNDLGRELWRIWSGSHDTNVAALLEAGLPASALTGPAIRRAALRSGSRDRGGEQSRKRVLFASLRYVSQESCRCWPPATRISVLTNSYPEFQRLGLTEYCSYAVERVLQDSTKKRDCLPLAEALLGCEAAGIAQVASARMVSVVRRRYHDPRSYSYFVESVVMGSSQFAKAMEAMGWQLHEDSFASLFVTGLADDLAQRYGLGSFEFIVARGLFRSRSSRLARLFTRNLVMSLGAHCFHRGTRDTQARYIQLVNHLLSPYRSLTLVESRRIALFLIRHSEATDRRKEVVVDARFKNALRTLASDRRIRQDPQTARWSEPLFRANGVRFQRP